MKVTEDIVDHIAHLARLEYQGESKQAIMDDMNRIINFMEKLQEVDTENVEPLVFMTKEINHLREDKAEVTISQQDALKNAPKADSDYFRIPKVLNK